MTFAGPLRRALYRLPSVWGSRRSLVSPFVTTFREMLEMRYLWREPVRMDDARLIAALARLGRHLIVRPRMPGRLVALTPVLVLDDVAG